MYLPINLELNFLIPTYFFEFLYVLKGEHELLGKDGAVAFLPSETDYSCQGIIVKAQ